MSRDRRGPRPPSGPPRQEAPRARPLADLALGEDTLSAAWEAARESSRRDAPDRAEVDAYARAVAAATAKAWHASSTEDRAAPGTPYSRAAQLAGFLSPLAYPVAEAVRVTVIPRTLVILRGDPETGDAAGAPGPLIDWRAGFASVPTRTRALLLPGVEVPDWLPPIPASRGIPLPAERKVRKRKPRQALSAALDEPLAPPRPKVSDGLVRNLGVRR